MTRGLIRITDEETPVLQGVAKKVPENGIIVEIGSAFGYSISKMADVAKKSVTLFAIDPWSLIDQRGQRNREALFAQTILNYQNIIPIKSFSQDVDWDQEIDLLFIDGKHDFSSVLHDYLKFSPFVKHGGFLVFHDYREEQAPGVTKVIDEVVIPSNLWEFSVEYKLWIGMRIVAKEYV